MITKELIEIIAEELRLIKYHNDDYEEGFFDGVQLFRRHLLKELEQEKTNDNT